MLSVPPRVRVFVVLGPFDMRGSYDALAGAVRRLGLTPEDGHFYFFINKRRHIAKVVWFDGSGWCVFQKRLELGTYQLPDVPEGIDQVQVDGSTLAAMLDGIDLRAPRRRWYRRDTHVQI